MREGGETRPDLPDDPAVLRAMLLVALAERDSLVAERDSIAAERDALAERNERLHHLLRKLQRMQFGPRSERLPEEQLQFAALFAGLDHSRVESAGRIPTPTAAA